jgi:hypothetical protein
MLFGFRHIHEREIGEQIPVPPSWDSDDSHDRDHAQDAADPDLTRQRMLHAENSRRKISLAKSVPELTRIDIGARFLSYRPIKVRNG